MRNFRCPYLAGSLREFWHRWHISFSTWLRDYVYIPLGGGRGPRSLVYRNLLITAAASGLWHGAAWHFAIWGLYHGLALVLERILRSALAPLLTGAEDGGVSPWQARWGPWACAVATFSVVCFGWVFFRAATLGDAWAVCLQLLSGVLQPEAWLSVLSLIWEHRWMVLGVLGLLIAEGSAAGPWVPRLLAARSRPIRWGVYSALVWLILLFGTQRPTEFIYFQF